MFTNLVLNAVDAMHGGGTLTLATRVEDGRVHASVADTGHGMDDQVQARCFDPFFTTKAVKGTGLGLSVAYGIVGRHKATIEVDSVPHEGTTFRLAFPPRAGVPAPAATPDAAEGAGSFRALVVDDEPAVLSVLSELLEALGHQPTPALGGPEGLAHLQDAAARGPAALPEVVFTDLGMPGVSGWDIAAEAKRVAPDAAVVLVTGWGVQLDLESARAKGVDYLLGKPFTVEDVESTLRKIRRLRDAGVREAA